MLQATRQSQQPDIYSAISESIKSEMDILQAQQKAHAAESRTWFIFCVGAATLGFLIIIAGSVAAITGFTPNGWVASLAGFIPTAVSALFFQQKKVSDAQVEKDLQKISTLKDEERRFQWVLKTDDKNLFHDFARQFFSLSNGNAPLAPQTGLTTL